jgi:hypothetical protein
LNRADQFLDLVSKGQDEEGFKFSMEWVRQHDQYRNTRLTSCCTMGTADGAHCPSSGASLLTNGRQLFRMHIRDVLRVNHPEALLDTPYV